VPASAFGPYFLPWVRNLHPSRRGRYHRARPAWRRGRARAMPSSQRMPLHAVRQSLIDMNPTGGEGAEGQRQRIAPAHFGSADDVAASVVFLTSEDGRRITGTEFAVNDDQRLTTAGRRGRRRHDSFSGGLIDFSACRRDSLNLSASPIPVLSLSRLFQLCSLICQVCGVPGLLDDRGARLHGIRAELRSRREYRSPGLAIAHHGTVNSGLHHQVRNHPAQIRRRHLPLRHDPSRRAELYQRGVLADIALPWHSHLHMGFGMQKVWNVTWPRSVLLSACWIHTPLGGDPAPAPHPGRVVALGLISANRRLPHCPVRPWSEFRPHHLPNHRPVLPGWFYGAKAPPLHKIPARSLCGQERASLLTQRENARSGKCA
jgi:hypothetical protein